MTFPPIRTMTIDSHDENVAIMRMRFITGPDGRSLYLTMDVGEHLGINSDEDGNCLDVLADFGIPFIQLTVSDRGQIIGPVSLVSDQHFGRLVTEVWKLRQDA